MGEFCINTPHRAEALLRVTRLIPAREEREATSVRVGILELLAPARAPSWKQSIEHYLTTKQHASIMPQAIAVWCRQLGHEVFYATYYGQGDPKKQLPDDLDVVFIGSITRSSALSYAFVKTLPAGEDSHGSLADPTRNPFPTTASGSSTW